jgi:molybdopterin converting factor subunit 1
VAEINVMYFAAARELVGFAQERVAFPETSISGAQLLERLAARHPRLSPVLMRMRLAINDELVTSDAQVNDSDEVAVLPPVAGGSDALSLVRDTPLSIDEAVAAVRDASAGAIAIFTGVVRDHADGKAVARLDYEAHRTLAEKEIASIVRAVIVRHEGVRVFAVHRIGSLAVGDLAVVVAASAAHRDAAFVACRETIEAIKARVPIWKKEWSPDGSAHWVNLEG